jgi:hypothetical protein
MNADQNQISVSGSISRSRRTDELSRYRYLYGFSGSWSDCTGMYGTGTCKVFRIRIQWMQIKIRIQILIKLKFWIQIQWIRIRNTATGMYLLADPDTLTNWVGTATYTVSPDPDPKYSYSYVRYRNCPVSPRKRRPKGAQIALPRRLSRPCVFDLLRCIRPKAGNAS